MAEMDAIYERVGGLDVHKKSVVACRRRLTSSGRVEKEGATFGTTTSQLLSLLQWLQEWDVTHVAMESTGYPDLSRWPPGMGWWPIMSWS